MAVPEYQTFMLPLLKFLDDGAERSITDAYSYLIAQLQMTAEDLKETLASGQSRFYNRVGWARTYLGKAGLLESTGRGRVRITREGLDLLSKRPTRIDSSVLLQYPGFREFKATPERKSTAGGVNHSHRHDHGETVDEGATPHETLEAAYQALRETLASDLLARVKKSPPEFFERLVVNLLTRMGYGNFRPDAGQVVGKAGDDGVDGIINEDKLGLDAVLVQAKRWDANVSRPEIQKFAGSLEGKQATKGVYISTSEFTKEATEYTTRIQKKIVLLGGKRLAELMVDYGVGVTPVSTYVVQRLDSDYFEGS